jgi:hypothetical protein
LITNEREIRIALEATLACTLAFYGLWGCALLVVFLMLPWGALFNVAAYLVQPIVDWRANKARVRWYKGVDQLVRELEALFPEPWEPSRPATPPMLTGIDLPLELSADTKPAAPFAPTGAGGCPHVEVYGAAHDLSAPLAIPPAIRSHLLSFPQGVLSDMELEVETVTLDGDTAEAIAKFQSSSVSGLVIRRRYVLRHADGRWKVESRDPANGSDPSLQVPAPTKAASVRR